MLRYRKEHDNKKLSWCSGTCVLMVTRGNGKLQCNPLPTKQTRHYNLNQTLQILTMQWMVKRERPWCPRRWRNWDPRGDQSRGVTTPNQH